jgi:hypothetical protein
VLLGNPAAILAICSWTRVSSQRGFCLDAGLAHTQVNSEQQQQQQQQQQQ